MATRAVTMPKMSMTMTEGTVATWLKEVGDTVRAGEAICEVATDKVDMEVEAPADGVLERIVAEPDDVIAVGAPLGYLTTDAEDLLGDILGGDDLPAEPADAPEDRTEAPVGDGEAISAGADTVTAASASGDTTADTASAPRRPPAVPAARRLAAEHGIALTEVTATGPADTIRVVDVELLLGRQSAAAPATGASAPPAAADGTGQPAAPAPGAATIAADGRPRTSGSPNGPKTGAAGVEGRRQRTRLAVARAMTASALVPQFTVHRDLDLTALDRVRAARLGGASWTAVLLKAHAVALRTHHRLNAFWTEDGAAGNDDIGIAVAVDSEAGLLAPVLRNPDIVPLLTLQERVRAAADAVRRGAVSAGDLQGGTTVFSNLGSLGVRSFSALLTPPQATALAVGAVRRDVVAGEDGSIGVRLVCTVGLTVDHRVGDGADAARLLAELAAVLADPARLGAVS